MQLLSCLFFLVLAPFALARPPLPVASLGKAHVRLPRVPTLTVFTDTIGGCPVPAITSSGDSLHPYLVDGKVYTSFTDAAEASCEAQRTICVRGAQEGSLYWSVGDCQGQNGECGLVLFLLRGEERLLTEL